MHHLLRGRLYIGALIALSLMTFASAPRLLAQTPGTTPIPANADWDPETQNALDAINALRAQQQPALAPLQVDGILQNIVAWTVNNQLVTKNCLGRFDQGILNCSNLDTLFRTTSDRVTAFGYNGAGVEFWYWPGAWNGSTAQITAGQDFVTTWTGTITNSGGLLDPNLQAIGIARQCLADGVTCMWWALTGTNPPQPFTPPAQ